MKFFLIPAVAFFSYAVVYGSVCDRHLLSQGDLTHLEHELKEYARHQTTNDTAQLESVKRALKKLFEQKKAMLLRYYSEDEINVAIAQSRAGGASREALEARQLQNKILALENKTKEAGLYKLEINRSLRDINSPLSVIATEPRSGGLLLSSNDRLQYLVDPVTGQDIRAPIDLEGVASHPSVAAYGFWGISSSGERATFVKSIPRKKLLIFPGEVYLATGYDTLSTEKLFEVELKSKPYASSFNAELTELKYIAYKREGDSVITRQHRVDLVASQKSGKTVESSMILTGFDGARFYNPAYSPDGEMLAIASLLPNNRVRIEVRDSQTLALLHSQIHTTNADHVSISIFWSKDSARAGFVAGSTINDKSTSTLYLFDKASNTIETVPLSFLASHLAFLDKNSNIELLISSQAGKGSNAGAYLLSKRDKRVILLTEDAIRQIYPTGENSCILVQDNGLVSASLKPAL